MDLEQFIDLHQYTDRDMEAILRVVQVYRDTHIDIISALKTMRQEEILTLLQYQNLMNKFQSLEDNDGRFENFILSVSQLVSFPELVKCLYLINCRPLAGALEIERFHRQMYVVEGSDVANGNDIVNFYSKIKSYCDDNVPRDRSSALQKFSTDLEQKIPTITNMHQRQRAADRYATIMKLRVKYYTESIAIKTIAERMKNNIAQGINTLYSDVLYHCNMGLACAYDGNELLASNHVRQVQVLSSTCKLPIIRAFGFYHLQYIYRCLHSKNPSHENFLNVLLLCDLGLNVLIDMNPTDIQFVRRIFLLNKIQTLLEIRADFSVNYSIPIQDGNLFAAEELLRTVHDNFSKIESRREMIYCLCKARTQEDKDLNLALAYVDRALVQGREGAYLKSTIVNITAYRNWLLLREMPCGW